MLSLLAMIRPVTTSLHLKIRSATHKEEPTCGGSPYTKTFYSCATCICDVEVTGTLTSTDTILLCTLVLLLLGIVKMIIGSPLALAFLQLLRI